MWLWSLPTFLVGVVVAVRARLTGPVAQTRRLARGTTAIADREVVTVEGTVRVHPLTIGRR